MRDDPATRLRENVTEITAMLVTGLWLFLLFSGIGGGGLWLAALLVGYVVVVPLVAMLYGDESDRAEWWDWWHDDEVNGRADDSSDDAPTEAELNRDRRDALETLRTRYAAGELTDEQFEHKLERLLEVETVEDAASWRRSRRADGNRDETRDRDLEYET